MDSILEYSKLCDITKGILEINISNCYRCRAQRIILEDKNNEMDIELDAKHSSTYKEPILYFQDSYNNMDAILSINFMEYILPISEYLNSLINNYLLETMLSLLDFNDTLSECNISQLIDFYHFSLYYIKNFFSYQDELKQIQDKKTELLKLRKFVIKKMNNDFNYKQFDKIYHFLNYMNEEVSFNDKKESYTDLTPISKVLLIKIKVITKTLLNDMKYFIENDESYFNELKIYKKLEFVIPFMNIINIIFYILIKN